MMATVPHVTSGLGLRKFQVDGFLLTRVYNITDRKRNVLQGRDLLCEIMCPFTFPLYTSIYIKFSLDRILLG